MFSFDLTLDRPRFRLQAAADIPLQGITGIVGKSGSGKTTLLRALAGLEPAATGRVQFAGEDWSRRPAQRRQIGFVFQDARLFRHLNVAQNLQYGAKRRGAPEQAVRDVIEAFDLQDLLYRRTASLSGGEARRVALGRALASQPKILFLDEPMVGLDTNRRAEVLPYITRAVDRFGLAVLYVSHSQFEMNLLADRVVPVTDGTVGVPDDGPPRFILPVADCRDGRVQFTLEDESFWLPGQGQPGEAWEIRPGTGSLLTQNHPGLHSAAAVLPVRYLSADNDAQTVRVHIAGQELSMPCATAFTHHHKLWLVCPMLRARHRPGLSLPDTEPS